MCHDGATQPHRLAGQSRVGVEAELRLPARGGVGDQLHLVGAGIVPREAHLLPRHEAPGELLDTGEAARQRDVRRDDLGQSLDQRELVGAHAQPDDVGARRRRRGEDRTHCEHFDRAEPRVDEAQPGERQRGGAAVHDRLPPRREPRVHPGERAAERELEIEGGVDDDGQEHEQDGECRKVRRCERVAAAGAAQPLVRGADDRRTGREMGGVAQRRSRRQSPQHQVAGSHRHGGHQGRARPPAVEHGENHDAEDVGGEAVPRERDPVAARQRAYHDERHELGSEARAEGGRVAHVRDDRRDDGNDGAEGDERPHEHARRRLGARRETHAGRSWSSGG